VCKSARGHSSRQIREEESVQIIVQGGITRG